MFKLIVALCLVSVTFAAVGGWKDIDAKSEAVSGLAETAIDHLNKVSESLYYRGLVEVKSAKQQVVNGLKYEVTLVLGETHCAKDDAGAKLCEVPANAIKQECVLTLWKESTAETTSILSHSCSDL